MGNNACAMGGDPGSNYLEHCGGYAWAAVEGLFGVDFYSDNEAAATISAPLSRLRSDWGLARLQIMLRGTQVTLSVNPTAKHLEVSGVGPKVMLRYRTAEGDKMLCAGSDCPKFSAYP